MQPLPLFVAAILGLVTLTYILYPLYRHTPSGSETATEGGKAGPGEREQNARQALQEVEFDFQLGNLEEQDYRSLRNRYMKRALVEMKERHQREQEIDAQIEAELASLKQTQK